VNIVVHAMHSVTCRPHGNMRLPSESPWHRSHSWAVVDGRPPAARAGPRRGGAIRGGVPLAPAPTPYTPRWGLGARAPAATLPCLADAGCLGCRRTVRPRLHRPTAVTGNRIWDHIFVF
jgi:hypothetical protein